jgi:hypothetical protein
MSFKHRDKKSEALTDSEIDAKTEAFADKVDKKITLTHKQSKTLDLSALSLEDLAKQYVEIDRQSHIIKGQILLEARKRFLSNNEFGVWRSLNFNGRVTAQIATHLMNLSKFFNEIRPLGNIPISAGYLIAAPKLEDIANVVYERVTEIDKPSLNDVKEIIRELKPDVELDVKENDNLEAAVIHLNKMTKKQLIELLVNNFNKKKLNKLILSIL